MARNKNQHYIKRDGSPQNGDFDGNNKDDSSAKKSTRLRNTEHTTTFTRLVDSIARTLSTNDKGRKTLKLGAQNNRLTKNKSNSNKASTLS